MEGFTSQQRRNKRFAAVLGLLLVASVFGLAAGKTPEAADVARVTAVRFWSLGDVTRIAIEASSEFHFTYERLHDPDRLYFDIFAAKPDMARRGMQTIPVDDGIVRQLRVAETQPGVTRVVVDLLQPAGLSTSQLRNPDRLMIEVTSQAKLQDQPRPPVLPAVSGGQKLSDPVRGNEAAAANAKPAVETARVSEAPKPVESAKSIESHKSTESNKLSELDKSSEAAKSSESKPSALKTATVRVSRAVPAEKPPDKVAEKPGEKFPEKFPERLNDAPESPTELAEASKPVADKSAPAVATKPAEPLGVEPPHTSDDVQHVLPAKRGTLGDRSLTRALDLKLGRVVIDPGHGGYDVGTHGPSGYFEKDLSLDVARRLAAIVQERMGSDVTLTRTDDTYVALEERTRIANERKADLFLSIHANSSSYRAAAGVETYILNFTTSKSAMDLAARENTGSDLAIHDLQDLLQKIALRDKIEESHELAASLQTSLSTLSTRSNEAAKNRGVKKAPFVVLIGATMPSVLAEIGFLSNSSDEALLRKPEHRQKIAEALYKGIASYADTLSHLIARKN